MCMGIGFHGTVKDGFGMKRDVAVIDLCDGSDAADQFLADFNLSGYMTIELSTDAMDEGRCELLGDMDTLHTSDDAPFTASWGEFSSYTIPADQEMDAQEQLTDTLLDDAKDEGYSYAQQDVTLIGGVRPMWAMRHRGQTIGW